MLDKFDNKKVQEEIDIYLSSLDNVDEDTKIITDEFKDITYIINNSRNPQAIIDLLNKYYEKGIISPLTLKDDEFLYGQDKCVNKRFNYIIKDNDGHICYLNAAAPKILHVYNTDNNQEVNVFPDYIEINSFSENPIWITKGGCCTGEYISKIYLKQNTVDKGIFIPHGPILLPVSLEIGKNDYRWSVDAREPKLKTLYEFYDVKTIKIDYKFDIRKYNKLKSNGKCKR